MLSRTLRDPSLELHYLEPGRGRLRSDGRTAVNAPAEGRVITPVVTADGRRIAEIVGNTQPDDHPGLLPAVATAAPFAIEHAALQAQLRAQVDELRASRERIVEAATSERRRIEGNLHDGAQPQLLAVGMQLDQLRRRLRRVPERMVRLERAAAAGPRRAPAHPHLPRSGASGGGILVEIEQVAATRRVAGRDDGRGGADGTSDGLRSLADRVGAAGGTLRIVSRSGGGTAVEARLPCG